jgi:hypothetical protein
MIISHKHKFIFIKTRKTAGSTLEKILFPFLDPKTDVCTGSPGDGTPRLNNKQNTSGHMPWQDVKNIFFNYKGNDGKYNFDEYYKFTIERNPWDKVVSGYWWHKDAKPGMFGDLSFEEYLLKAYQHQMLPVDWIKYTNNNNLVVDDVFFYENMWKMYQTLNEKFEFDITENQMKNTKMKGGIRQTEDYKELHTPKSIDYVNQIFSSEIKQFGYTYDG